MGKILKFIDRYIRNSNEKWHQDYCEAQERELQKTEEKRQRLNAVKCCANCRYFEGGNWTLGTRQYQCKNQKHEFCFDYYKITMDKVHQKKYCNDFEVKEEGDLL